MAENYILPLIIVEFGIGVHHILQSIITDVLKCCAEQRTRLRLEPVIVGEDLINVQVLEELQDVTSLEKSQQVGWLVLYIDDWTEGEIFVDEGLYNRVVFGEGRKHLNGTLGVTDVMDFFLGLVGDVAEGCWKVVVRHVLEWKFPEFGIFFGIVFCVVEGVLVPSTVAHPQIIAPICKQESRGFILIV